jgi:ubiquinone biosynthesis protein UbiJ
MKQQALKTLEKSLNALLKLDPETVTRLEALNNAQITLCLRKPHIDLNFTLDTNGFHFQDTAAEKTDLKMTVTLAQLIKTKLSTNKSFPKGMHMEGDTHIALALEQLFQKLDIDWEEHLSRFVGDVFAYKLGNFARKRKENLQRFSTSMQANMSEMLQEEAKLLPTSPRVDDFLHQVDRLALATDRLEARINHLEAKRTKQ